MPRTARPQSSCDLYHVTIRGINQVQLFCDDVDRREFLVRQWRFRDECGIAVLSWCLMGNHVHLLVRAGLPELSSLMKRLQLSYSHYYNSRYDRQGYLFQGRFGSVPIESDAQLCVVIRYIHRNPLDVGLGVADWTSYDDIATSTGKTDHEELLSLLSPSVEGARRAFSTIVHSDELEGEPGEYEPSRRGMSDREAMDVILEVTGSATCQSICEFDSAKRNEALAEFRRRGLSVRQIARLTGLSRGVVQRVKT